MPMPARRRGRAATSPPTGPSPGPAAGSPPTCRGCSCALRLLPLAARLGLATPFEHGLGAVDVAVGDDAGALRRLDRHGVVVGGEDDPLHAPLLLVDVREANGDELADLALEVAGPSQRPLHARARDL